MEYLQWFDELYRFIGMLVALFFVSVFILVYLFPSKEVHDDVRPGYTDTDIY